MFDGLQNILLIFDVIHLFHTYQIEQRKNLECWVFTSFRVLCQYYFPESSGSCSSRRKKYFINLLHDFFLAFGTRHTSEFFSTWIVNICAWWFFTSSTTKANVIITITTQGHRVSIFHKFMQSYINVFAGVVLLFSFIGCAFLSMHTSQEVGQNRD